MKTLLDVVKPNMTNVEEVAARMCLDAPVKSTSTYSVYRVAHSPIAIEVEYYHYDDYRQPTVHIKDGYFKTFVFGKKTEALCGLYGLPKKLVKILKKDETLCRGFFNMIYTHATETKEVKNDFYRFYPETAERKELVENLIKLYTSVNHYDVKLYRILKFTTTDNIKYIYSFMNGMM